MLEATVAVTYARPPICCWRMLISFSSLFQTFNTVKILCAETRIYLVEESLMLFIIF